jgi:hypothetical protein
MAFLDKNGLARLWANILSLIQLSVPTKVSQLENDEEYITVTEVISQDAVVLAEAQKYTDDAEIVLIGQKTDTGSADTISGAKNFAVNYVDSQLDTYILNIDYETFLAFDTSEIVIGATTTSVLGQAILGQMVLA